MTLLGEAAVAMWWEIASGDRSEFQDWHSHEHFPERMSLPGFLRGSRWESAGEGEGFFVMYELEAYETLTSAAYLARLNDPTPWSTKMMPKHRNMVRSQCRVATSNGGGVAAFMATIRLSPKQGGEAQLQNRLVELLRQFPQRPGITGAHLLRTDTPQAAPTEEQRIRGGDQVADWIILLSGYELDGVRAAASAGLEQQALVEQGASPEQIRAVFRLSHSLSAGDLEVAPSANAHPPPQADGPNQA